MDETLLYDIVSVAGADLRELRGGLLPWAFDDYGTEYVAATSGVGLADLTADGIVVVSGADAATFLQSLLSQDVAKLGEGEWRHSLLLDPKGKINSYFKILREEDRFLLHLPPGYSIGLIESLNRFRIRVEVEIAEMSQMGVVRVTGPESELMVSRVLDDPLPDDPLPDDPLPEGRFRHAKIGEASLIVSADATLRGGSIDLIGEAATLGSVWVAMRDSGAVPIGHRILETLRIESGEPVLGAELDGSVMVQEAGLEDRAVSFSKGCYLGQELVARIASRGHVNRHLRGIVIADAVLPPLGAEIVADDRVVGSLTSVGESLDLRAPVGLGFVRREVEPPFEVEIRWTGVGGVRAEAAGTGLGAAGSISEKATALVVELPLIG